MIKPNEESRNLLAEISHYLPEDLLIKMENFINKAMLNSNLTLPDWLDRSKTGSILTRMERAPWLYAVTKEGLVLQISVYLDILRADTSVFLHEVGLKYHNLKGSITSEFASDVTRIATTLLEPKPKGKPKKLSKEAKEARKPPPPETLVGALQDRLPDLKGKLLKSIPIKVPKSK